MKNSLIFTFLAFIVMLSVNPAYPFMVDSTRTRVNIMVDKDKYFYPDLHIAAHWSDSERLYSGIGFEKSTQYEDKPIPGFGESRISSTTDENRANLTLIGIKSTNSKEPGSGYTLRLLSEYTDVNRKDFGYFQYQPDDDGPWVATDNQVEITYIRPGIGSAFWYNAFEGKIKITAAANLYPSAWLDAKQKTVAKPLVDKETNHKSSEFQKPGGSIGIDISVAAGLGLELVFSASYDHLPMKYTLSALEFDELNQVFIFTPREYDTTEKRTVWEIKLQFPNQIASMRPLIGFRSEQIKTDGNDNLNETKTKGYSILGLEGNF